MARKRSRDEFEQGSSRKQAKFERCKADMLKNRQRELDSLIKEHDDLVRELFHLENFYLLSYNPEEARQDTSEVFQKYAAQYDLLSSASTIEDSPTKTRKTRSGFNELKTRLTTPIKPPIKIKLTTKGSQHKINGTSHSPRRSAIVREPPPSPLQNRGRGTLSSPSQMSMRGRSLTARKLSDAQDFSSPSKVKAPSQSLDGRSSPPPEPPPSKRRKIAVLQPDRELRIRAPPPSVPPAKGKPATFASQHRESPLASPTKPNGKAKHTPLKNSPRKSISRTGKERAQTPTSLDESEEEQEMESSEEEEFAPLPPSFPRTMRIYQRPPLFVVTHPSQRPLDHLLPKTSMMKPKPGQKPKPGDVPPTPTTPGHASRAEVFGVPGRKTGPVVAKNFFSVSGFLTSYWQLDFPDSSEPSAHIKGERTLEELEKIAEREALVRERIAAMQREGRLPKSSEALQKFIASSSSKKDGSFLTPAPEPKAADTIRTFIIKDVSKVNTTAPAIQRATRDAAIKKTTAAIAKYWTIVRALEEKRQKEELKRVKALAKKVWQVVETEWKKAVYHIKERLTAVERAEAARLGQIALDEVIEKSGKLLGVQKGGMLRARLGHEASGSGDEEDSDEENEEQSEEEFDPDVTMGSHMLLGDVTFDDLSPFIKETEGDEEDEDEELVKDGDEEEEDGKQDELEIESHLTQDEELSDREVNEDGRQSNDLGSRAMSLESSENLGQPEDDEEDEDDPPPEDLDEDEEDAPIQDPILAAVDEVLARSKAQTSSRQSDMDISEDEEEQGIEGDEEEEDANEDADADETLAEIPSKAVSETPEEDEDEEEDADEEDSAKDDMEDVDEEELEDKEDDNAKLDVLEAEKVPETEKDEDAAEEGEEEEEEDTAEEPEDPQDPQDFSDLPKHLRPYAAAVVEYDPSAKVEPPALLHGTLRPYQHAGLEWLATLHTNHLNGILADEMGLGKTIQTISLLAHLACDQGIWGPHLVVVPTSVILNWEMEFKKFLPGFRVLSYHGNTKRRKELRVGWNNRHAFNVCITSYTLASRDAHIFKRKPWYYFILDEAHMIKNFKSQRWNILLSFRSYRRLLLTGTPLQNNLTELWSLLRFLMSDNDFVDLKEFGDWFANPLEKAIEVSSTLDEEMQQRVNKLHTVLRPYLLRRLKIDVEKELPNKYEHVVMCRLSKRQRFLYDEFMQRAHTREALASGVYQKVANILMQLRKVCNHPDLFEVRPIVTSFAMERSAIADFEIQEFLIRKKLFDSHDEFHHLSLPTMEHLGLVFTHNVSSSSQVVAQSIQLLDEADDLPLSDLPSEEPPADTRSIQAYRKRRAYCLHLELIAKQTQRRYLNRIRCQHFPTLGLELINTVRSLHKPLVPFSVINYRTEDHFERTTLVPKAIMDYASRSKQLDPYLTHFAFVTPAVVAQDLTRITLAGAEEAITRYADSHPELDAPLHHAAVRLQIAFPDATLLEYDCGKLQELARLLRERRAGGHRVLIFTQMTKILDILEIFLNVHGWLYLRLDGATKIEDRQYVTERFNADTRVFAFIASSRSGGVGVNLTGADTVIFYDSDFNPQMDRQCEDRAHRIGQIRDVHIYRFISQYTVEESIFRKANQKRSLDDIVIQQGEFDWRTIFEDETAGGPDYDGLNPMLSRALGEFEEEEDARAARLAAREEAALIGEERAEFEDPLLAAPGAGPQPAAGVARLTGEAAGTTTPKTPTEAVVRFEDEGTPLLDRGQGQGELQDDDQADQDGGSVADFMLKWTEIDWEYFSTWKL